MNEKFTFADVVDKSILGVSSGATITFIDIFAILSLTLLCSLIIAWVYRKTYQGVLYQRSFGTTLILGSLVTSSIIMVISGNLILSLGMVGALSIVRFRAAIKDPLDIIFMFWAISVGIANGVAYFKVSIVSTLILTAIMLLIKNKGFSKSVSHLLVVKFNEKFEDDISKAVSEHSKQYNLKSKFIKNGQYESVYEVSNVDQKALMSHLDNLSGVDDVSLMSTGNGM
jgi:hypothetical protein